MSIEYDTNTRFRSRIGDKKFEVCLKKVYGLNFEVENLPDEERSELKSWAISDGNDIKCGFTLDEFYEYIIELTDKFDLKVYHEKTKNDFYRDQLLVYTPNPTLAYSILKDYVKDNEVLRSGKNNNVKISSFIFSKVFCIADSHNWCDEIYARPIAEKINKIVESKFLNKFRYNPNGKHLKSPANYDRECLKTLNTKVAIDSEYEKFKYYRKAYYGGTTYIATKGQFKFDMALYDRTSAYIYEFFMPFCCSKPKSIKTSRYTEFIDDIDLYYRTKGSIGTYKIKFIPTHNFVQGYLRDRDDFFLPGETYEEEFVFLNEDLKTFLKCVEVIDIECIKLEEFIQTYLPKEYLNFIIELYMAKELAKTETDREQAKKNLQPVYGNMCMNLSEDAYQKLVKFPYYNPIWGYQVTSYARSHLFNLGTQLYNWVSGHTDSIFCEDSDYNRELIRDYNDYLTRKLVITCMEYQIEYEQLLRLGTYNLEDRIKNMIIRGAGQYRYVTDKEEVVVKACGMTKEAKELNSEEDWLNFNENLKSLPKTIKILKNGNYYEKSAKVLLDTPKPSDFNVSEICNGISNENIDMLMTLLTI